MGAYDNVFRTPGMGTEVETNEWFGMFGRDESTYLLGNKQISGAARDAGNTPTTILRGGLVMGEIVASKKFKEWSPSGVDGSQYAGAILTRAISTQQDGANADSFVGRLLFTGLLKAGDLLIPGEATYGLAGKDNEFLIRNALAGRFLFDDGINLWDRKIRNAIVDTTFTTLDHGARINNLGAVAARVFTIPSPKPGLLYYVTNLAGQQITVNSAATNEFLPVGGTPADSSVIANTTYATYRYEGISTTLYQVSRETV